MTPSPLDLVAVGSAVVDYTHRVSVLPKPDEGVAVLDRRSGPGGVEANAAAAAAQLGLRVGIITRVGADAEGQMLRDDFQRRGIDTSRVQLGGEGDTAYTMVFVDPEGERMMMTGGPGVRRLTLDAEDDAYIRRARACFTSGYLPPHHLARVAAICGQEAGPLLAFDLPGTFDDLEARGLRREHVDAALRSIDLFLTNRESLASYTATDSLESGLEYLHARGVRRATVSDGRRGLYLFEAGHDSTQMHHVPAFSVRAVDTTGAGDVLHAALIAEWLLAGRPAAESGRFAAAAAALSCQGWGCRAALPTREEAEELARL